MLSGKEIQKRRSVSAWKRLLYAVTRDRRHLLPDIVIEPFDEKYCGPNSYDVHLGPELLFYKEGVELSAKAEVATKRVTIPEEGFVLQPGDFCLGSTLEYIEVRNLTFQLTGRSSIGRMGLSIVASAGFGDVGFCGNLTMHMKNLSNNPIRLTPNLKIGQIFYDPISRDHTQYSGKYLGQKGTTASLLHKDTADGTM